MQNNKETFTKYDLLDVYKQRRLLQENASAAFGKMYDNCERDQDWYILHTITAIRGEMSHLMFYVKGLEHQVAQLQYELEEKE